MVLMASLGSASPKGPFIFTVEQIRELKPGAAWDPNADDFQVQVRGYLRERSGMAIYPTRDQALLDDFLSAVAVSDEGEGALRNNCAQGFVELISTIGWMKKEQRPILIPTRAKKLTLREHGRAEEEVCWESGHANDS